MKAKGFTLFELLLVVALIGLIATLAAPAVSSNQTADRAQAEAFLLDVFKTARQNAMRLGQTCGVHVTANPGRIRYYRYAPGLDVDERMIFSDTQGNTDFNCIAHPLYPNGLSQTVGSGVSGALGKLSLTFNQFRGVAANGTTFRTGHIQFDAQGRPWVFNSTNEPVPLTVSDPTTQSPLVYSVGSGTGGLVVCPFTGHVFIKTTPDAASPCTLPNE